MNTIEQLLELPSAPELPTGNVKISLAKFGGKEVDFEIRALTNEEEAECNSKTFDISLTANGQKSEGRKVDTKPTPYRAERARVATGCPAFKNKALRDKFGVRGPNASELLVDLLLTADEVEILSEAIEDLSAYDTPTVDEVKN